MLACDLVAAATGALALNRETLACPNTVFPLCRAVRRTAICSRARQVLSRIGSAHRTAVSGPQRPTQRLACLMFLTILSETGVVLPVIERAPSFGRPPSAIQTAVASSRSRRRESKKAVSCISLCPKRLIAALPPGPAKTSAGQVSVMLCPMGLRLRSCRSSTKKEGLRRESVTASTKEAAKI